MKKLLWVCLGIVLMLLAAVLQPTRNEPETPTKSPVPRVTVNDGPDMSTWPQRQAALSTWLASVAAIQSRMPHDPLVQTVAELLNQNTLECLPYMASQLGQSAGGLRPFAVRQNGLPQSFSGQPPPGKLPVVIFLSQDQAMSWWADVLSGPYFANFSPANNNIGIKEYEPTSDSWKGIMLLHEGLHAHRYMTEHYDWLDSRIYCYKEVEAHQFQNRLMLHLGGAAYQEALRKEIERSLNTVREEKGNVIKMFASRSVYDVRLDEAFGPAQSDFERDSRQTSLWIHAQFEILERYAPPAEVEEKKAVFLKTIYVGNGVLR